MSAGLRGAGNAQQHERTALGLKTRWGTDVGVPGVAVDVVREVRLVDGIVGGFAPIKEGTYNTTKDGRGRLGGDQVVHITAEAEEPPAPDSPEANFYVAEKLFRPYETTVELPNEITTMDFQVPDD